MAKSYRFIGDVKFGCGWVRRDLSESYRFGKKDPQEVAFSIDAVGTVYEVVLVPKGKEGNFADVYMEPLQ